MQTGSDFWPRIREPQRQLRRFSDGPCLRLVAPVPSVVLLLVVLSLVDVPLVVTIGGRAIGGRAYHW